MTSQNQNPNHPLNNLDVSAQNAIENAYAAMRASFCGRISTLHLLIGVLNDEKVIAELEKLGLEPEKLKGEARALISQDSELATSEKRFSNGAKRALERAKIEANRRGRSEIGALEIVAGLLPQSASWKENRVWGKDMDDGAAILAKVDAKVWGEILGPIVDFKSQEEYVSRLPMFWVIGAEFLFLIGILFAAWEIRTWGYSTGARLIEHFAFLFCVGLPFIFAKKRGRKRAWQLAFNVAIGGFIISFLIAIVAYLAYIASLGDFR